MPGLICTFNWCTIYTVMPLGAVQGVLYRELGTGVRSPVRLLGRGCGAGVHGRRARRSKGCCRFLAASCSPGTKWVMRSWASWVSGRLGGRRFRPQQARRGVPRGQVEYWEITLTGALEHKAGCIYARTTKSRHRRECKANLKSLKPR